MGVVRLGTSSWTAIGWERAFYPSGTGGSDRISFYAHHFDTVEIDMTFYRIPAESMVLGWRDRTTESFRFAAKVPQSVTSHVVRSGGRVEENPEFLSPEGLKRFVDRMNDLGPRMGPLLLQFPYFPRQVFSGLGAFLPLLDDLLGLVPPQVRFALEIRNPSWFHPELFALLSTHEVALALTDLTLTRKDGGKYGPPVGLQLLETHGEDALTTDFLYVRLLGDRWDIESRTDTWERVVRSRDREIHDWARLLEWTSRGGRDVFAYANNHYEGFAPETVRKIRHFWP